MRVLLITIDPPRAGIADLHAVLLCHPSILDCMSEQVYTYIAKTEDSMSADELGDLIAVTLPSVPFIVAMLHPQRFAGYFSHAMRQWLEAPPPPLRHEGHQPDLASIGRLPPTDILEYSAQQARLAALIAAPVEGEG
ncbi:hypothetical protein WOC76_06985 [Methylocystis sp. IM3]|uniref:hypothetical protein n=1 Tax=unclassified Methylocystis TaxID=2625913 RepID=UPI0030F8E6F9